MALTTGKKAEIGAIVAAIFTGIYLATRPKVKVEIGVDVREDGFIYPYVVVRNMTSEYILIREYQITLDDVNWDWSSLPWSIPARRTEEMSPGWINPSDYGVGPGLHTASLKLRDAKERIYTSNTISFTI